MIVEIQTKQEDGAIAILSASVMYVQEEIPTTGIQAAMEIQSYVQAVSDIYLPEYSAVLIERVASGADVTGFLLGLNKILEFPSWVDEVYYMTKSESHGDYEVLVNYLMEWVTDVCNAEGLTYEILER